MRITIWNTTIRGLSQHAQNCGTPRSQFDCVDRRVRANRRGKSKGILGQRGGGDGGRHTRGAHNVFTICLRISRFNIGIIALRFVELGLKGFRV